MEIVELVLTESDLEYLDLASKQGRPRVRNRVRIIRKLAQCSGQSIAKIARRISCSPATVSTIYYTYLRRGIKAAVGEDLVPDSVLKAIDLVGTPCTCCARLHSVKSASYVSGVDFQLMKSLTDKRRNIQEGRDE